jgi:hypothetical protein
MLERNKKMSHDILFLLYKQVQTEAGIQTTGYINRLHESKYNSTSSVLIKKQNCLPHCTNDNESISNKVTPPDSLQM